MSTALLTTLARLAEAPSLEAAAEIIIAHCANLESVDGAFVLTAAPGASSLEWVSGRGLSPSPRLLMRVEHGLREWMSGVKPPPDHMTGFPPAHAIGIKGEDGAPPIHVYPDRTSDAERRAIALLGVIRSPEKTTAPEDEAQLLGARDLLRLANRPTAEADEPAAEGEGEARARSFTRDGILTRSPAMERIFRKLDRVVALDVPVLVMGETGTGKELIARAVHQSSPRARRRFYAQNCGAITEGLLESELFGYLKGAFTGAERDKKGLFEVASGSTLFLDEIGEMNLEMQKKLLRVLQQKEVLPIGASEPRSIDVRIVCATNRDLKEEVAAGRFREDLYYRLKVIEVVLPPLRERREDIPLLIDHFLDKVARTHSGARKHLDRRDSRVLDAFLKHEWRGNIRELENTITRLAHFAGDVVTYELLSDDQQFMTELEPDEVAPRPVRPLDEVLEEVERSEIENALRHTRGNRTHAADLLRVNRRSLLRRLKKYGFPERS